MGPQSAAMAGELKENSAWVPLTPSKSDDIINPDVGYVEKSQFPRIHGNGKEGSVDCAEFMVDGNRGKRRKTVEFEVPFDSTKASSVPKNAASTKRSRKGIQLNRNPLKKKLKMKRPKVFVVPKPVKPKTPKPKTPKPKTPKPKTPKRVTRAKKDRNKEVVGVVGHSKNVDRGDVGDHNKDSCRRKLVFYGKEIEPVELITESCFYMEDQIDGKEIEPVKLIKDSYFNMLNQFNGNEIEQMKNQNCDGTELDVALQHSVSRRFGIVYQRRFKPIIPKFPRACKKTRAKRKRVTVYDKYNRLFSMIPSPPKQRRRRTSRTRSLGWSRKSSNAKVEKSSSNFRLMIRKRRSNTTIRRWDFSSFVNDLSKLQFSEAFLLKASSIRRDFVEVQDDGIQQLETENPTPLDYAVQEYPSDRVMCGEETKTPEHNLETDMANYPNAVNGERFSDNYDTTTLDLMGPCHEENNVPVTGSSSDSNTTSLDNVPEMGPSSDSGTISLDLVKILHCDASAEALVDFAIERMECLKIGDGFKPNQSANGELVSFQGSFEPLKKLKQWVKVDLDPETMRVWNLLMENSGAADAEEDDEKSKYWKEERELFRVRVDRFLDRMHLIQGDRRFSPWKGSVVDSVVGVYLTQNVSDHLSSSAFMSLAARFPPPSLNDHDVGDGTTDCLLDTQQEKIAEPHSGKCEELLMMENVCGVTNDCVQETEQVKIVEPPSAKCEELLMKEGYPSANVGVDSENGTQISSETKSTPERKKGKGKEKQESTINWDDLRKQYSNGISRKRTNSNRDSVNWEAVRQTTVEELANVIIDRGMHNQLAARIKDFLDRMVKDHGSIDLEWLRNVPPDTAKEYLLSIIGLGLKSVECVRLLCLHHHAFPVDVNVARILVRLGWVPLQPLPDDVQIHLLEQYPLLDPVQKYIWPRVCDRTQPILYEFHSQLIAFGKAICTKKQPNCNACPMRGDCKHYASALASSRLRLGGSQVENTATVSSLESSQASTVNISPPKICNDLHVSEEMYNSSNCEPIVEFPASPKASCIEIPERDIEDFGNIEDFDSEAEIPTIRLNSEEFIDVLSLVNADDNMSKALVALTPEVPPIPIPKLKDVQRLRTVHCVYELPDSHPLLLKGEFKKREIDDPCPYLLAIWETDETSNSSQEPRTECNCGESIKCTCPGETTHQYQNDHMVQGTIMIPCRTANTGSFPLNGTYFQVNEVFADHKSSRHPIAVPREWIWNLNRRLLYCGTSMTSICRGMSIEEIAYFFWRGFTCIRGVDRKTGGARPLAKRFHHCKTRQVDDES